MKILRTIFAVLAILVMILASIILVVMLVKEVTPSTNVNSNNVERVIVRTEKEYVNNSSSVVEDKTVVDNTPNHAPAHNDNHSYCPNNGGYSNYCGGYVNDYCYKWNTYSVGYLVREYDNNRLAFKCAHIGEPIELKCYLCNITDDGCQVATTWRTQPKGAYNFYADYSNSAVMRGVINMIKDENGYSLGEVTVRGIITGVNESALNPNFTFSIVEIVY